MYGLSKWSEMLKPESCIFVDKTGCNCNQTKDGNGDDIELSFFRNHVNVCGRRGAETMVLQFIALSYIAGTREALLCVAIL